MKIIKDFFNRTRPNFEKGGKYEKLMPFYETIETFFFVPGKVTKIGTHIKDVVDLKRVMIMVILALIPTTLFGIWNIGYQHFEQLKALGQIIKYSNYEAFMFGFWKFLPMVLVSYAAGLGIEFLFAYKKGHELEEGFLVSGLLIPLIMPADIPLWVIAISSIFAALIGKEVFGGTGMNIWNPALLARAFAFFAYPSTISGDKVWVAGASKIDALSGETVLGQLKNNTELMMPNVNKLYSVSDMFFGFIPGSIGETSTFLILLGGIFLIFTGIGSWKIMVSTFLGGAFMGWIFNILAIPGNNLMEFEWWKHLMIGGFAFGAVFMATDPVSGAQTDIGKWIYGFLIGVFSIIIRIFNPAYPEGVMLAILLMNTFAPTIDHYVIRANVNGRLGRLKVLNK